MLCSLALEADAYLRRDFIDIEFNVSPYMEIEIISHAGNPGDLINFGELTGKAGVYWINGTGFTNPQQNPGGLANAHTDGVSWVDVNYLERAGGPGEDGRFIVRTNDDINISFRVESR